MVVVVVVVVGGDQAFWGVGVYAVDNLLVA